jgi:hypothetical protein
MFYTKQIPKVYTLYMYLSDTIVRFKYKFGYLLIVSLLGIQCSYLCGICNSNTYNSALLDGRTNSTSIPAGRLPAFLASQVSTASSCCSSQIVRGQQMRVILVLVSRALFCVAGTRVSCLHNST